VIAGSLARGSGIVVTGSLAQAVELANTYAPEHLCLLVQDPWQWLGAIRNAGGVFLGERSFEVLGDYVAGPSHVMPTGGTARFGSPLNVNDFTKIITPRPCSAGLISILSFFPFKLLRGATQRCY
jgi:histidinol dehydrogenase